MSPFTPLTPKYIQIFLVFVGLTVFFILVFWCKYAHFYESINNSSCSCAGKSCPFLNESGIYNWLPVEIWKYHHGCFCRSLSKALYFSHIRLSSESNFRNSVNGFLSNFYNTIQEKLYPWFDLSILISKQFFIVNLLIFFEICREKKYRLFKKSFFEKKKCNEHSPSTSIAIKEWMNSFELSMEKSCLDNR